METCKENHILRSKLVIFVEKRVVFFWVQPFYPVSVFEKKTFSKKTFF